MEVSELMFTFFVVFYFATFSLPKYALSLKNKK